MRAIDRVEVLLKNCVLSNSVPIGAPPTHSFPKPDFPAATPYVAHGRINGFMVAIVGTNQVKTVLKGEDSKRHGAHGNADNGQEAMLVRGPGGKLGFPRNVSRR